MIWPFVALATVAVVAIGLIVVGRESFTLGRQPQLAVFDIEEAVEFAADRLPDDVTARISFDDVRALVQWYLGYLRDRGVPRWREHVDGGPVVVEDEEAVAWVLGRADEAGVEVTDRDVVLVLDATSTYLAAIGAVGGEVAPPQLGA